jgi:hypothetical protein
MRHRKHVDRLIANGPNSTSRKVVTSSEGNAAPGHNLHSGRRGPRKNLKNAIGDPRNGLSLRAPGSMGAPLAPGIGPGDF